MYDCSKEFNKFYRTSVVLPENEQNELREKRKLNVKRLKEWFCEISPQRFSMNRKLGVMMQREKDFGMRLMREDL